MRIHLYRESSRKKRKKNEADPNTEKEEAKVGSSISERRRAVADRKEGSEGSAACALALPPVRPLGSFLPALQTLLYLLMQLFFHCALLSHFTLFTVHTAQNIVVLSLPLSLLACPRFFSKASFSFSLFFFGLDKIFTAFICPRSFGMLDKYARSRGLLFKNFLTNSKLFAVPGWLKFYSRNKFLPESLG